MQWNICENKKLNEKIYCAVHSSGVSIYFCPKPLFAETYVMFGTKFGSTTDRFIADGEDKPTIIPDGTAHFLEHKMFENEDGIDVFDIFGKYGASANAFTSFDKTVYEFSCTDNFEKNLETLLKFVQAPYFTKETVAKEQGIIGQEIRMYEDTPSWRVMLNLLKAMYKNNSLRIDIAGTVESIAEITPEMLYKIYDNFYNPANMALCICGPADPDVILNVCDRTLKKTEQKHPQRILHEEQSDVYKSEIRDKMPISIPYFCIGVKDFGHTLSPTEKSKREIAFALLLNILFGKSSEIYKRLYEDGLINESFDSEYSISDSYSLVMISGESMDPDRVYTIIKEEIAKLRTSGISDDAFDLNKRALLGGAIDIFDKTDDTVYSMMTSHFSGIDFFDSFEAYYSVTKEDVSDILDVFIDKYMSISVIEKTEKV